MGFLWLSGIQNSQTEVKPNFAAHARAALVSVFFSSECAAAGMKHFTLSGRACALLGSNNLTLIVIDEAQMQIVILLLVELCLCKPDPSHFHEGLCTDRQLHVCNALFNGCGHGLLMTHKILQESD